MRLSVLLVGAAVAASVAGIASADPLNVVYNGTTGNLGKNITVSLSGGLFFQNGASSGTVWAGQYSHNIDGVDYKTFCTELTQFAGSGLFNTIALADAPRPGSGMGQVKADAIYRLFNATNKGLAIDTNAKAAAFQATIWEIVYEYDGTESALNLDLGNVTFSSGINAGLFSLYSSFATAQGGDSTARVIAITNDTNQDQILSVPLPGAAAMAGLGLLGLTTRRRRQDPVCSE